MKRFAAVALLALLAVAGTAPTVAPGHTKSYASTLTVQWANYEVTGTLRSPIAACERNREIGIYFISPSGGGGYATRVSTDQNGNWKSGTGLFDPNYRYRARLRAKNLLKNGEHSHTCKPAVKLSAPVKDTE